MKKFLKIAAALAVIAGALVVIVKFGKKILDKIHGCKCWDDECCCCYETEEEEKETPAAEETEKAPEEAPAQPAEDSVTPEDFVD